MLCWNRVLRARKVNATVSQMLAMMMTQQNPCSTKPAHTGQPLEGFHVGMMALTFL